MVAQVLSLPLDKVIDIMTTVCNWLGRRMATKRELLSLIGKLSFATKVVPAGRLFLRRLINRSTTVDRLHHHLRIGAEARADLEWWARFLPQWNGRAKFLEPQWSSPASLNLSTDASGSHGFGAYFDRAWLRGTWPPHQTLPRRSIQWQELFVILVAASAWSQRLCSRHVTLHGDNQAVVQAWSGLSSRSWGYSENCSTISQSGWCMSRGSAMQWPMRCHII